MQGRNHVRNQHNQAGVQIHLAEEAKEVYAVVGDEGEFVCGNPLGQNPVRLPAQTEVIDMGGLETSGMSDFNQRLVQAFVDQEPHVVSRVRNGKDFRPVTFFPCKRRRLGRPRRGNACMYIGAIPIFSLFRVG